MKVIIIILANLFFYSCASSHQNLDIAEQEIENSDGKISIQKEEIIKKTLSENEKLKHESKMESLNNKNLLCKNTCEKNIFPGNQLPTVLLTPEVKKEEEISNAVNYVMKGKYYLSIEKLNNFIAKNHRNSSKYDVENYSKSPWRDIFLILGVSYDLANDNSNASLILDKLTIHNPTWEPIYLVNFERYKKRQSYFLAEKVAKKALDRIPSPSSQTYYNIIQIELILGQLSKAEALIEKSKTLFPSDPAAEGWLGALELKKQNLVSACKHFSNSYSAAPQNDSIAYFHAACLIQSHQFDEAQQVIKLGLFQSQANPDFYYLGGILSLKTGDKLISRQYLENFLRLAPTDDSRIPFVTSSLQQESPLLK